MTTSGIVTENGVAYPPFEISLKRVVNGPLREADKRMETDTP